MTANDIQSDEDVELLVHVFYGKVQDDKRLDFIFNDFAEIDWNHHLPRMVDFWSNLLFQTGRYKGRPYRQHTRLPIEKKDFSRWMNLFESTVDELFDGKRADYAKEIAAKIASSFALRMEMDGKFD